MNFFLKFKYTDIFLVLLGYADTATPFSDRYDYISKGIIDINTYKKFVLNNYSTLYTCY